MKKALIIAFSLLVFAAKANNVTLSNVSVANNVAGTGKVVQFDLSWENSWRTNSTGNYDGVWVFFKFKDNNGSWKPLQFNGNNITMPNGVGYTLGNNGGENIGVGMFLYRSANGSGTFTITNAKAGIASYPGTFEVRGFALEMVYIPQGSFYVGDSSINLAFRRGATTAPYLINSNGAGITMGSTGTALKDPFNTTGYNGNLAGFPTGFSAYWMMKYELSRGGFRDFLNTLNYTQQTNLFMSTVPPSSVVGTPISIFQYKNAIEIASPGVATGTPAIVGVDGDADNVFDEATDGEWKPVTGINWIHMAAYLDWSGLRPMTVFEYEKACRGPSYPVPADFAWGTDGVDTINYIVANNNTANETATNASSTTGNAITFSTFPTGIGYVRGGFFANAFSTRVSSGAGYYGAMELTGNLYELCVTPANAAGRSYSGKHGDGVLTTTGYANENYWPGVNGSSDETLSIGLYDGGAGVRASPGLLKKGSSFFNSILSGSISYQAGALFLSDLLNNLSANINYVEGIRGVRDAN